MQLESLTVEELAAEAIIKAEKGRSSLRGALEELGLKGRLRSLVLALSLGYLRNYKLVEHALRLVKGKPPRSRLAHIIAYEAMFRRNVSLERLKDIAERRRLPLHRSDLRMLRELDPRDVVRELKGLKRISVEYSQPLWVVSTIVKELGFGEARRLLESYNRPHTTWLVILADNPGLEVERLREKGIELEPDPYIPRLYRLKRGSTSRLIVLARGKAVFMDRLSALAASLVMGGKIYDACAAPGGKTLYMSSSSPSLILSTDISPKRLERLNAWRRNPRINIVVWDSTMPASRPVFEASIVDPDCSSLGRLGHSPETRLWLEKTGPSIIRRLAEIQLAILEKAVQTVKPGGLVVYSTCTLTTMENEGVISRILRRGVVEVEEPPPLGIPAKDMLGVRLYTHIHHSVGGFVSLLKRT